MTKDTDPPTSDQFEAALQVTFSTTADAPESSAPDASIEAPTFSRLSELITDIPEGERHLALHTIEDGIVNHGVTAIPLAGERFTVSYRDANNRRRTVKRADELVLVNDNLKAWLATQRAEARRALMLVTGDIIIAPDDARSNPDLAMELGELRRRYLTGQQSSAAAPDSEAPARTGRKPRAKKVL